MTEKFDAVVGFAGVTAARELDATGLPGTSPITRIEVSRSH